MRDIALAAGVSVATVSLALRNDPRVRKERREQLQQLAEQMGYSPNPLLSSLASRRFRNAKALAHLPIAFLTHLPGRNSNSYSYVGSYLEGASPRASELGYRLEHFELSRQKSTLALSRMLHRRGFGGVIIGPVRDCECLPEFDWERFSVVACGGVEPSLARRFHWIKSDFFGSTRQAYRRGWDLGYRRIVVVLAEQAGRLEESDLRQGAIATVGRHLHPESQTPVFSYVFEDWKYNRHSVKKRFLDWINEIQPDLVIGYSLEFYYALLEAGKAIPRDIAYISLHINPRDRWYDPLSGYCIAQYQLGRAAVDALDAEIHYGMRGEAEEPHSILLLPNWIEGKTLPPRG